MGLIQSHTENPLRFISSDPTSGKDDDLLTIAYQRVQNNSPDFISVHEGINQAVDIHISTFKFCAAPEPVISLYDFVMTTFVPQTDQQLTTTREPQAHGTASQPNTSAPAEQIRVLIKLASVQRLCFQFFCNCLLSVFSSQSRLPTMGSTILQLFLCPPLMFPSSCVQNHFVLLVDLAAWRS
jgi:hypothetical protein